MLKTFARTYNEFDKAQNQTKAHNCDEAACLIGKRSQRKKAKIFSNNNERRDKRL
jgi:hypothetical protein